MLSQDQLAAKIVALPDPLRRIVADFIDVLLLRYAAGVQTIDDLDAREMTAIADAGGAFQWLNDQAEDGIYSDQDGEPI